MKRRATESRGILTGMNLFGVVGWIFADMLLVLVVIFLATQTGGAVVPEPKPSTVSTPKSPPPTPPKPTALPPGVDSGFVCFRVLTDPVLLTGPPSPRRDAHLSGLERQVADRLTQPDLAGRTAGIVLSFGVADQPGDGQNRAAVFNSDVLPRFAKFFHRSDGPVVANRAFWGGRPTRDKPSGAITVNVYPIVDAQHPSLVQPPVDDC